MNSTVAPSSRPAPESTEFLSPAQQVLRSIQTDFNNDVRKILLTLNPPGLGMVRIQFQQEGNDISGVLEVQKAEIRKSR